MDAYHAIAGEASAWTYDAINAAEAAKKAEDGD